MSCDSKGQWPVFHWSHRVLSCPSCELLFCTTAYTWMHSLWFLKEKIYYGCGVCSSNLQIDFSSLTMKHYYIKWEKLTWLLLGKKQRFLFCCPLTLCLLSLVLMALHNFPTFSATCSNIVPVPHLSEQSLSHRELPAWNIWVTIISTGFQHRDPKAESLGLLDELVLCSSQKRVVSIQIFCLMPMGSNKRIVNHINNFGI